MSAPSTIRLPPLEELWPWPRAINTYLADVEQECVDWCVGFGAFKPETHGLIYEHGNFSMLLLPPIPFSLARPPCVHQTRPKNADKIANSSSGRHDVGTHIEGWVIAHGSIP
jgi:hypothetical protein